MSLWQTCGGILIGIGVLVGIFARGANRIQQWFEDEDRQARL